MLINEFPIFLLKQCGGEPYSNMLWFDGYISNVIRYICLKEVALKCFHLSVFKLAVFSLILAFYNDVSN